MKLEANRNQGAKAMTTTMKTTVEKTGFQEYLIKREDGEKFLVVFISHRKNWIIENQGTFDTARATTLKDAKFSIQRGWDAATKFQA